MKGSPTEVRGLADWFRREASSRAPDAVRASVRDAVARTAQAKGAARVGGVRVTAFPGFAVGSLAAVVALVIVSALVLRPGIGEGGAGPTRLPTPAPTASVNESVTPTPARPVGVPIAPGPNRTERFTPTLTFMAPVGWIKGEDHPATLYLNPADAGSALVDGGKVEFDGIDVYSNPVAGPPDGGPGAVAGVRINARDLADWLSTRSQLTATTPVRETLMGHSAYRVDFHLSPAAGVLCGLPCVNLFNHRATAMAYQYGIVGATTVRGYLLDTADGGTLFVAVEDVDGNGFDATLARAQPILESFALAP